MCKILPNRRKQACQLRSQGLSINEIAKKVQAAKSSVSLWVRHLPQPEEFTAEHKTKIRLKKEKEKEKQKVLREKNRVGKPAPIPFEKYYVYPPRIYKNDIRKRVTLVPKYEDKQTLKPTQMLYSRFLMSIKLKRVLKTTEYVDHKDEDPTNDDIANLQVVTPKENKDKNLRINNKTRLMVAMLCPACGKPFEMRKSNTFLVLKNKKYNACSRPCIGKISKNKNIKTEVIREYRV